MFETKLAKPPSVIPRPPSIPALFKSLITLSLTFPSNIKPSFNKTLDDGIRFISDIVSTSTSTSSSSSSDGNAPSAFAAKSSISFFGILPVSIYSFVNISATFLAASITQPILSPKKPSSSSFSFSSTLVCSFTTLLTKVISSDSVNLIAFFLIFKFF